VNRLIALLSSLVAVAAIALVAGVHLDAARAAGPFTVTVTGSGPYAFQDSNGDAPADLEVPLGASVTFVNPTGGGFHDVDFDNLVPSACAGSPSVNSASASSGPWQGACTFNTAGSYDFHCSIHFFTGEIIVDAGAGATGSSGSSGASGATGATGGGGSGAGAGAGSGAPAGGATSPGAASTTAPAGASQTPVTGATAGAGAATGQASGSGGGHRATIASLSVPAVAHGFAVSASARVAIAGSTLRALLLYRRTRTLGALTRRHVGPGRVAFTLTLSRQGRALLGARRKLAVVLAVAVSAPDGSRDTLRRALTLKR
jgi:plastocyanin